jgi:ankyrin repeat protein
MMVLLREKDIQLNVMNKNNDTLLHSIAEWGKEKGIKELFKVVPDIIKSVNDKNKEGNTPLHCVAIKGNKNALTEFLEIEGIGVDRMKQCIVILIHHIELNILFSQ